jgi:type II secretory pathway predicted ATPase ExeA
VAFVTNSLLGFDGILEYVLADLGIAKAGEASTAQRLMALQTFLVERHRAGQNTVLMLDEAQNLDQHALEQIRLLSNFETTHDKTLQILLAGQPELRTRLELPQLRQLKQRIGLRCRIALLAPDQVSDYIRTRLRVAGASDLGLFSRAAVARIAEYTGGVPRLVNTVCDHCLVFAYADRVRRIGPEIVEEVVVYLEDGEEPRRGLARLLDRWPITLPRWTLLAASVAAATLLILTAAHPGLVSWGIDPLASSLSDLARSARALLRP